MGLLDRLIKRLGYEEIKKYGNPFIGNQINIRIMKLLAKTKNQNVKVYLT